MSKYECAVLYHNYYDREGVEEVREKIRQGGGNKVLLLCSLSERLFYSETFKNSANEKFVLATNVGKDIGGKLLLIDLFIKAYRDIPYIIFLHDKKSYQKYSGGFEKETLFEILKPENYKKIYARLQAEPKTGIVCHKNTIKTEFDRSTQTFNTTNSSILQELVGRYISGIKDYHFVAGTMFWAKSAPITEFFTKNDPIMIRSTLEQGNVLDEKQGTVTHSWERMLSWIITSKDYSIQSI